MLAKYTTPHIYKTSIFTGTVQKAPLYLFQNSSMISPAMSPIASYVLINTGKATRTAFMAGVQNIPCATYRSKELILHITSAGDPLFIHRGTPIDFTNTYVFTRLRATDAHFCGMMNEYFVHHNIPANDLIHLAYPGSAGKISQMLLLALQNIRIPETIIFREEAFAANLEYIRANATYPLVYKTDGSRGRNVHIVDSFEALQELVALKRPHVRALIQPFIENTFDTRTLVAYDTVLGTIKRTRANGYLNNVSQGAAASQYELTPIEKDIAIRAAQTCRIDFAGVDMIHTAQGPLILEVNKSPQIQGFESVHHFKVFTKLAEVIQKKYGLPS